MHLSSLTGERRSSPLRVKLRRFERVPDSSASPPIAAVPLRRSERPLSANSGHWPSVKTLPGAAYFAVLVNPNIPDVA
jgi:hypothetical protein